MNKLMNINVFFSILLMAIAVNAGADIAERDLPENVQWYAHADLAAMEGSVTGRYLLEFLEEEVFAELEEETGIALRSDLTAVTVFGGDGPQDGAVLLSGNISDKNRKKINAVIELYGDYSKEMRKGTEVFALDKREREGKSLDVDDNDMFAEGRTTYVAFGKKGETLLTQNKSRLDAFVSAGGKLEGRSRAGKVGSLLVLEADRSMVKAGMNAGAGIKDGGDWDSSVLKHMRQVALVLSDKDGKAAVEAQLTTANEQLAESIRNIVQGVISIKALDDKEDADVLEMLRSIRLEQSGSTIRASMLLDPETLKEFID